jgi:uncharacterized protein YkwD
MGKRICSKNRVPILLAAGLTMLLAAAELYAAPRNGTAQNVDTHKSTTLAALVYPPQLFSMSDPDCAGSSACQSLGALETQMLALVNADRLNPANAAETGGHALPLKWDPRLAEAALAHSEDMAAHGYFSHFDRSGRSPAQRVSATGVPWRALGENIAKNYTVVLAEQAFMNEPAFQANHRANILNPNYNYVGIGIFRAPDGWIYATQEFAQEP